MAQCQSWAHAAPFGNTLSYEPPYPLHEPTISGHQVIVDWAVDSCSDKWLLFSVGDYYSASYSLEVDVKGPIGVEPFAASLQ